MASYCIMTVIELTKPKSEATPISRDLKIRKGDKFECIEDVIMDDGEIAYRKGGVYVSERDSCITDLQGCDIHIWETDWPEYFKRIN